MSNNILNDLYNTKYTYPKQNIIKLTAPIKRQKLSFDVQKKLFHCLDSFKGDSLMYSTFYEKRNISF